MTVSIAEHGRDDRAAVDKAISLLVSFGDHGSTGVGVSELARRAQLSKSTAFRVLGMLERNGVVERVGRNYRLGARLHELGRTVYAPGHERVRDLLIPFLTDLYELTRETVHVATLHGTEVVYLAKLYGHRPAPAPSRIGGRMPAYCTAVGKVLLAYDPDAAADALSTSLRAFTANTITDPVALAAELDAIRRDGIAFDDEESQVGLSCVAVPVMGPGGKPVAAFSVAGATGRIDTRRQGAHLRRVSAAATRALTCARLGTPTPRDRIA
ncbi:IclR family transcriptional regulator [Saccharothrix deserti]|uniref:IclR family transcriptional regulator n=1 Tax=Saccharothrix deserti TaxID=2593674 RepID=UPI00131D8475|nr:IclR family transcriptional regulator [Saccharothrix deserti]